MVTKAERENRGKCRRCGGPKEIKTGMRYCDACKTKIPSEEIKQKRAAARARAALAPAGHKWCPRCDVDLPLAQFNVKSSSGRPESYCIPCQKAYLHEARLKKVFGIDAAEYDRMLAAQGGRCAICRCKPRTRRLAVDHDHKSGELRGLLCTRCNHKVLGAAHEDPIILRRAAAYLDMPPTSIGSVDHLESGSILELEDAFEKAAKSADGRLPVAVVRCNGQGERAGEYLAMITFADLVDLLLEAGYGDPEQAAS